MPYIIHAPTEKELIARRKRERGEQAVERALYPSRPLKKITLTREELHAKQRGLKARLRALRAKKAVKEKPKRRVRYSIIRRLPKGETAAYRRGEISYTKTAEEKELEKFRKKTRKGEPLVRHALSKD